jgi:hypothetical protein
MFGIEVSESTVAKYMICHPKSPSQTWRTFLDNHVKDLVSIDFFTVPTATFRILYVPFVLHHERRTIVHFNVTASPTATWTAQQLVEAFHFDTTPCYLLRDRDSLYGTKFRARVRTLGIEEVHTAPRSPERHLKRVLRSYVAYYLSAPTHVALDKQCPKPRPIESVERGEAIAFPHVGGLHHEYQRLAAREKNGKLLHPVLPGYCGPH